MTDRKPSNGTRGDVARTERLAGAPISWGVCEVPGWGPQLPAAEVLAEMRAAGLRATEAGADGFLPAGGDELARLLADAGLALVGGFVPVVLHDPTALDATLSRVRAQAERFARAGGTVLLSAVVTDEAWSPRVPLSGDDWRRIADGLARLDEVCAQRGVAHLLHPHVGTLVETRADVERVLDVSEARLCLDTGHLAIGGVDSVALACEAPRRVGHVHLKDVRESVAAEVRAGRASLVDATRRGLFVPLGEGDAPVAEVLRALGDGGYEGWYVLEQDTVLVDRKGGARATDDVRRSIAFLRGLGSGHGLAAQRAGGR
jgi:inosose dehydratase